MSATDKKQYVCGISRPTMTRRRVTITILLHTAAGRHILLLLLCVGHVTA